MNQLVNFIQSDFTFTLSGSALSVIILALIIAISAIAITIINLLKKLQKAQQPKYGFLGKPLYQAAIAIVVVSSATFSVFTATRDTKLDDSYAKEDLNVEFRYNPVLSGSEYTTTITIIPYINEVPWSNNTSREFDIFINYTGPENGTEIIYNSNSLTQATFVEELKKGSYQVTITIISDNLTETFVRSMSF